MLPTYDSESTLWHCFIHSPISSYLHKRPLLDKRDIYRLTAINVSPLNLPKYLPSLDLLAFPRVELGQPQDPERQALPKGKFTSFQRRKCLLWVLRGLKTSGLITAFSMNKQIILFHFRDIWISCNYNAADAIILSYSKVRRISN